MAGPGSVAIQPMPARIERELEMALGLVDHLRRRRRVEDPQDRVAKAARVDVAQFDVAAVTVGRIGVPTVTDALCAVGLADVLTAIAGIGDEVDAHHGCQRGPPRGVPVLAHDGLQLRMVEDEPVEAGKRNRLRIGDFHDWVAGRRRSIEPPGAWGPPSDHETADEVCEMVGRNEVEGASSTVVGHLASVLQD